MVTGTQLSICGYMEDWGCNSSKIYFYMLPSTEKLSAVKHANGIDYWVFTKEFGNNSIVVYKVNCSGLDPVPVISNIGMIATDHGSGIGGIKASPDGKKSMRLPKEIVG